MNTRKALLILCALAAWLVVQAQDRGPVPTLEIPVRVYDGDRFVDDLGLKDLEIYDEGQPQFLRGLYLVRGSTVARHEGEDFKPTTTRNIYLLFQLLNYDPRIVEVIENLFQSVIQPGDTLTIVTLQGEYVMSRAALEAKSKDKLAKEMTGLVRKDTALGASQYNALFQDIKRIVAGMTSGEALNSYSDDEGDQSALDFLLPRYKEGLEQLESLRFVNEKHFVRFAQQMKARPGQNLVFFFYEREFRPEVSPMLLNQWISIYQNKENTLAQLQELFALYQHKPAVDGRAILAAFADSSLLFNFLFLSVQPEFVTGISMTEQSEDLFKLFTEASRATGGLSDSSQNFASAFQRAVDHSSSYYLLYYSPSLYVKDGTFKSLKISVKEKDYTLYHRNGYFATR